MIKRIPGMCYFFVLLGRLMFNITMLIHRSSHWACQLSCDSSSLPYSACSGIFFTHIIKNCPGGKVVFYPAPSSFSESSVEVCTGDWHFLSTPLPHCDPQCPHLQSADSSILSVWAALNSLLPSRTWKHSCLKDFVLFVPFCIFLSFQVFT